MTDTTPDHPGQHLDDNWARAFVARIARFDRFVDRRAESGLQDALEESALTLDVLIRDARIALGTDPEGKPKIPAKQPR